MPQVIVRSLSNLQQEIVTDSGHRFVADEPEDAGGGNTGPTPYDLLLAAFGACTTMTLLIYARRKGWPLEGVEVRLSHERVHGKDCEECEDPAAFMTRLGRVITLSGPLDDEQRSRLMEIARKCPVHKTLVGPVSVEDSLTDGVPVGAPG